MGAVARVLLCSRNEHKRRELERALPGWQIELLEADYPEELGASYYENARAKAECGRALSPDALLLGEDSGLEVVALHGEPGLHSARWSERPIDDLLDRLQGVPDRRARYVCELVLLAPGESERRGTGTLEGHIAAVPRGTEGFGYDPVFVPRGQEHTVAELGNEWKAANSHRARAALALHRQVD
ncbi:MAG: non-canonical purine NTP pyrophosphatase [Candidatus Rokuibacteriota bacterium]|nr:MAG: non-canonical purine NTP pyrophosphatase [Candidatus Rokubacteria bacterium]